METMNTSESWWDSLVDFATNNAVAFWVIVAAVVLALIVIIALIVDAILAGIQKLTTPKGI